jgi:hypothetical protein
LYLYSTFRLCIHSSADDHFVCFQFWTVVNSIVTNVGVQVPVLVLSVEPTDGILQ